FGIVAGTGTGKTLAIRPIATTILQAPLKVGVVNREREATPETPTWNVVIVTTGIARRWFEDGLITARDTLVVDEIHQTSAELELCLALGKRARCRFIWLSATVDPAFYARYLGSVEVLETRAFDPAKAAQVRVLPQQPLEFLNERFVKQVMRERRGVAVFVPTRAEVEQIARELGARWPALPTAFYHGGVPTPPEFQLAGDAERVAITCAALGVDAQDLDLPVPLDRRAYREALQLLTERGLIEQGRLTRYGREVEAMPVDRPWGELLYHAE